MTGIQPGLNHQTRVEMGGRPRSATLALSALGLVCLSTLLGALPAAAHGIGDEHGPVPEASFASFLSLGAQHMITGFDHLLFVAGIVVLVRKLTDVVKFATAFTIGHSITLLAATLAGWTVNARLIDVLIAVSVVYIGVEIVWGDRLLRRENGKRHLVLDPKVIVYGFGLLHGLGLATRFQALAIPPSGLLRSILGFNVGVELGQLAALLVLVSAVILLHTFKSYDRWRTGIGAVLIGAGIAISSYLTLAAIIA